MRLKEEIVLDFNTGQPQDFSNENERIICYSGILIN